MALNIGQIISLVISLLLLAFLVIGLLRKKAVPVMIVYGLAGAAFIGVNVASWFVEGMGLAVGAAQVSMFSLMAILAVVYANDFKRGFLSLGRLGAKQHDVAVSDEEIQQCIEEIVDACQAMSKVRMGALIVVVPTEISKSTLESGVEIKGLLSAALLQSIFNTRAPIHDGAVIVKGNKILAAGCFLPLSQTTDISKDVGTRHRAAIGITEESDNLSIVVSEENGIISVAKKGILRRYITSERLSDILYETYGVSGRLRNSPRNGF